MQDILKLIVPPACTSSTSCASNRVPSASTPSRTTTRQKRRSAVGCAPSASSHQARLNPPIIAGEKKWVQPAGRRARRDKQGHFQRTNVKQRAKETMNGSLFFVGASPLLARRLRSESDDPLSSYTIVRSWFTRGPASLRNRRFSRCRFSLRLSDKAMTKRQSDDEATSTCQLRWHFARSLVSLVSANEKEKRFR